MSADNLRQAITLARAGDKTSARKILEALIEQDPQNEMAWIWMTDTTDSPEERRYCLEIALSINPNNVAAKKGLEYLGGATTPPTFDDSALPKNI